MQALFFYKHYHKPNELDWVKMKIIRSNAVFAALFISDYSSIFLVMSKLQKNPILITQFKCFFENKKLNIFKIFIFHSLKALMPKGD